MSEQGRAQTASSLMSETIAPLIAEARDLRATVANDGVLRRKENRRVMALIVVLFLMVGFLLTIVVQNRIRSNQNGEILRRTAATNQQVVDCTTPAGKCFQESQKRTAGIIGTLVDSNIAVHKCVEDNPRDTAAEIRACVMKALTPTAAPAR